jgi:hypothetical protein
VALQDHVQRALELKDELGPLLRDDERPFAWAMEDVDDDIGSGRCLWVFTDQALNVIDRSRNKTKARLPCSDRRWQLQIKSSAGKLDGSEPVLALIWLAGRLAYGGVLPMLDDMFVVRLLDEFRARRHPG